MLGATTAACFRSDALFFSLVSSVRGGQHAGGAQRAATLGLGGLHPFVQAFGPLAVAAAGCILARRLLGGLSAYVAGFFPERTRIVVRARGILLSFRWGFISVPQADARCC